MALIRCVQAVYYFYSLRSLRGNYMVDPLPSVEGFQHNGFINLNPSYFIFPAWINVFTGDTAEYPLSAGMQAIRNFSVTGSREENLAPGYAEEDYYSSSLKLLAQAASSEAKFGNHPDSPVFF